MDNYIYEVSCAGNTLRVYEDCVSFTPKGMLGFFSKGVAGERKIFYKDIASIQFKESSRLLSGFIEFYVVVHLTKQGGGLFAGTSNENRFTFYHKFLPLMCEIRDYVQNKINSKDNNQQTTVMNQTSSADELRKFKQLLDEGIISQEEFDTKKKQILGL